MFFFYSFIWLRFIHFSLRFDYNNFWGAEETFSKSSNSWIFVLNSSAALLLAILYTFYSVRCPHIRKCPIKKIRRRMRNQEMGGWETVIATLINFHWWIHCSLIHSNGIDIFMWFCLFSNRNFSLQYIKETKHKKEYQEKTKSIS